MPVPPCHRLHLIYNPLAGACRAARILEQITPILEEARVIALPHESSYPGHARSLTRALDLQAGDGVCGVGGDGTMHEIVGGLMTRPDGRRAPVGLIPAGSGNSLLHDLHCLDPRRATRRLLEEGSAPLDLMEVHTEGALVHAFNVAGWGLAARAAHGAERIRWAGPGRYTVASLLEILRLQPRQLRLVVDGEALEGRFLLALVCNTQHTGTGMRIAPRARFDDGWLDLLLLEPRGRLDLVRLLAGIRTGTHLDSPAVIFRQVREFSLASEAQDQERLVIDGEVVGRPPFHLRLLPAALQLLGVPSREGGASSSTPG